MLAVIAPRLLLNANLLPLVTPFLLSLYLSAKYARKTLYVQAHFAWLSAYAMPHTVYHFECLGIYLRNRNRPLWAALYTVLPVPPTKRDVAFRYGSYSLAFYPFLPKRHKVRRLLRQRLWTVVNAILLVIIVCEAIQIKDFTNNLIDIKHSIFCRRIKGTQRKSLYCKKMVIKSCAY